MFDSLFGDFEQKQNEVLQKVAKIIVDGESGDGAVKVSVNGNMVVQNIVFDKSKLEWDDQEMVEELLIQAINRALDKAKEAAAIETEKSMKDILPPGFDSLFGK